MKQKELINPEKAREMLRKEGIEISQEEAKSILDFLRIIAKIAVSQYLRNGNS